MYLLLQLVVAVLEQLLVLYAGLARTLLQLAEVAHELLAQHVDLQLLCVDDLLRRAHQRQLVDLRQRSARPAPNYVAASLVVVVVAAPRRRTIRRPVLPNDGIRRGLEAELEHIALLLVRLVLELGFFEPRLEVLNLGNLQEVTHVLVAVERRTLLAHRCPDGVDHLRHVRSVVDGRCGLKLVQPRAHPRQLVGVVHGVVLVRGDLRSKLVDLGGGLVLVLREELVHLRDVLQLLFHLDVLDARLALPVARCSPLFPLGLHLQL
mmetsp:Transcript_11723/g.35576  ORF Transcript_11723/g.35576 Transcript_11723/m.35576 type:complete len:264 (-) Transcript_11723:1585-2376(-)